MKKSSVEYFFIRMGRKKVPKPDDVRITVEEIEDVLEPEVKSRYPLAESTGSHLPPFTR